MGKKNRHRHSVLQPSAPQRVPVAKPASVVGVSPPLTVAEVTETEAADLSLSPAQRTAIFHLTTGRTRADAAIAAGVSRTTLYRWFADDPAFQAAFNTWQSDVRTTAAAQLLAATHAAVATVTAAIQDGDKALAWKLLTAQGLTLPRTLGSTDADELAKKQMLAKKKEEIATRKELIDIKFADMTTFDEFPNQSLMPTPRPVAGEPVWEDPGLAEMMGDPNAE